MRSEWNFERQVNEGYYNIALQNCIRIRLTDSHFELASELR
jgi:hypothetical protein